MLMQTTTATARAVRDRARRDLLQRARLLPQRERAMVELMIDRQMTCADVGRLIGMHPGNVSRLVRRSLRRLGDPVSVALCLRGGRLPADVQQLGIEHFVRGIKVGELSAMHGMTRYRVRQVLDFLRGWAKGTRE